MMSCEKKSSGITALSHENNICVGPNANQYAACRFETSKSPSTHHIQVENAGKQSKLP